MISGYQTQAGFDRGIIGFDSNPLMLQPVRCMLRKPLVSWDFLRPMFGKRVFSWLAEVYASKTLCLAWFLKAQAEETIRFMRLLTASA